MGQFDRLYAQLNVVKEETKNMIRYTLDDVNDPKKLSRILDLENILLDQMGEIIEVIYE